MYRGTVSLAIVLVGVCASGAFAQSPYIYGIHDHDPGPQEYLNHIEAGGATGWVTALAASRAARRS